MTSPTTSPPRLHALDAVRGVALLLGIALHAALAWMPGASDYWITFDADSSSLLAVLFHWIHSFRMPLFFVLAGFFARLVLERRGAGGYLRDRLRRLGLPLLAAWPLVFPAIVAAIAWNIWLVNGRRFPEGDPPSPMTLETFPLTHLWFLYLLLGFCVAMLAWRLLLGALDRHGRLAAAGDRLLQSMLASPLLLPLLAVPTALTLFTTPDWRFWFGIPTPDTGLLPNRTAVLCYGFAFAFGWALQRLPDALSVLQRQAWPALLIGFVASVSCLLLGGTAPVLNTAVDEWFALCYAGAYALAGWAWTIAAIAWALRLFDRPSAVRRYLADASYWMYIAHLPLVMAGQVLMTQFGWPWWVEFPLVLSGCIAVLLVSYQLLIRGRAYAEVLDGRRPTAHSLAGTTAAVVRQA